MIFAPFTSSQTTCVFKRLYKSHQLKTVFLDRSWIFGCQQICYLIYQNWLQMNKYMKTPSYRMIFRLFLKSNAKLCLLCRQWTINQVSKNILSCNSSFSTDFPYTWCYGITKTVQRPQISVLLSVWIFLAYMCMLSKDFSYSKQQYMSCKLS